MADKTGIEWTDATWNPLRGCARVSQGCKHCYAERVAARFSGPGQPYEGLIHPTTKGWNGSIKLIPEALQIPWRWSRGRRIFVNSMSDLFHEDVPFEFIAAVFFVMAHTTRHTYQVLTKRPARMLAFFRWVDEGRGSFEDDRISDVAMADPAIKALGWEPAKQAGGGHKGSGGYDNCGPAWPYENVWLGVSVEDQATADERIPLLLQCPAEVRWISAEPLLGPVDLRQAMHAWRRSTGIESLKGPAPMLHWVVAGGESGPGARPMHPAWARSLRDQCAAAGVPFLFKQWGEWVPMGQVAPRFDPGCADKAITFTKLVDANGDTFCMDRLGKKRAGRELDGQLHDGYPK
jgi:protein gp37